MGIGRCCSRPAVYRSPRVEYALILALIAILVIVVLKFLQPQISNTLNKISNSL